MEVVGYIVLGLFILIMLNGLRDFIFGKSKAEREIDELQRLIKYLQFLIKCCNDRLKVYNEGIEIYSTDICLKEIDERDRLKSEERGLYIFIDVFGKEEAEHLIDFCNKILWYGGDKIKTKGVVAFVKYLKELVIQCEDKIKTIKP